MSAPLDANGMETGAVLSRHFTRAGRDPLALAPFEERMIEGRSVRVPASWAPGALAKLSHTIGESSSSEFLTEKAKSFALNAGEAGLLHDHEPEVLADELAWILARGMGWVAEEAGMWVGVLNLHHFCEPVTQRFDLAGLRQAGRCLMIAAAGQASKSGAPGSFSLGWTNGAGFLLVAGIPYDSSRAVGILGCVSAMILGEAALTSARLAERCSAQVQQSDKDVVLAGLSHAKAKVSELPPTGQVTPPGADSGRWASQTQEVLNEAVAAVTSHGVLGAYPTAPQAILEAESWLDPLSRLAEAIPSLQVSDLAARPEIRSSLKAMGLAESQRGAVLTAISTGGSILEAGVPETKAPSLKTALGAWSFHPNAQVMMGAAVAPFVAGILQHRIILPDGIPDEFRSTVMAAAQRFGLSGALPYVHGAEASAEPIPAEESSIDQPLIDEILPPAVEPESTLEPEDQEEAAFDAESETQLLPEEQAEQEAASEGEPAMQEVSEEIETEGLVPPPLPETEVDPLTDVEVSAEAEPVTVESSSQDQEESDSATQDSNLTEEPVSEDIEEELAEAASEESAVEPEVEASNPESDSKELAEPDQGLAATALVGALGVGGAAAMAALGSDDSEPAVAEEIQAEAALVSEPLAEPVIEEPSPEELLDSGFEMPAPSAQVQPTFWSKSANISSQGVEAVLHVFRRTEGGPIEAAVTTYQLTAMNKILLDSLLTSVNLGLSKGVSIKDYARSITQPGLVRDLIKALADLSEA